MTLRLSAIRLMRSSIASWRRRRCGDVWIAFPSERDTIGKSFGVYDYPKESQRDTAMYRMIKEKAAEKAKRRVQKKLLEMYDSDG